MNQAANLLTPLPDTIEPKWWTGVPALALESFTIDCSGYARDKTPLERNTELHDRMLQTFEQVGAVHLINTGLEDLQQMRLVARHIIKNEKKYEGGANPRNNLQPNVYEVGAPLQAWLHYHHEMAYIGASTKMLAFLCNKAVAGKGYTYISDNLQATDAILATEFGQKLKDLGLCYHRDLTDREAFKGIEEIGVYNHWQKSMLTDNPEEAVEQARKRGLEVEWGPNRLLKTRYYVSAFEYFPQLDRNLLYSSVADDAMWFDAWPKVMHLPFEQRPLKLTFGNGEEMTRQEKQLFVDIYDRFGIPIQWQVGDIAIICNYRFAHGRPSIHLENGEERELGVLIGEAFDRVETAEGKW